MCRGLIFGIPFTAILIALVWYVVRWEAVHVHRHRAIMIDLVRRLATGECAAATTAESPPRIAIAMPGDMHEPFEYGCRAGIGARWDIPEVEVKWFGPDADVDVEVHRAVEYWLEAEITFTYFSRIALYLLSGCIPVLIGFCLHLKYEQKVKAAALQQHRCAAPRGYVSDKGDDEV